MHALLPRAHAYVRVPHASDSHPSSRVATLLRNAAVEKHSRKVKIKTQLELPLESYMKLMSI